MELVYSILLGVAAFWLGACPFSLWLGRWLLHKDIRHYGDRNPGATNVFRSGSMSVGILALLLDIAKGVPFVLLAHLVFKLPDPAVYAIGLCAILGHAYSPFLRFKGGKALAVTAGVLLAQPYFDIFVVVLLLAFLSFLFSKPDAWTVMFAIIATTVYVAVAHGISWELLFMLCVLAILVVKHFEDLKTAPRLTVRPIEWLRAKNART
ncbi:MAG: glycerol-3-phosphate acyltransferase [Chloroflexi bacterium]|nr:glycerol-3-phosphate acyltransferase [Chloroflexota bacterium]MBM3166346.1 glycerol-3-phosphate acyltransferase [Chloroflexota bacterium]MBM3172793.1 glycerol-3-phosphate acyltransferase [Chloroflexota bacterium]MBM4451967.1 glycerol-3-phosphate acyltransferase [Chloroflexota bacterium]